MRLQSLATLDRFHPDSRRSADRTDRPVSLESVNPDSQPLHFDSGDDHARSGTADAAEEEEEEMFAPAAPLARAVDKAKRQYRQTRRRVRDEVDVARDLYQEATLSPQEAHREGEPVPEEMDAEEAAELVDDEYRPLMSDDHQQQQRGAKTPNNRQRGDESDSQEDEDDDQGGGHAWTYRNGDGAATKARKLEVWLAQGIFFVRTALFFPPPFEFPEADPQSLVQILGAAILLSWNTEIVAGSYFGERLKDSPFERSFANFVALTFTTANLLFLAWANATQAKASQRARMSSRPSAHLLMPYLPAGGLESPDPVESVRPDRHPVHLCRFDPIRQYQSYVSSETRAPLVVSTAD